MTSMKNTKRALLTSVLALFLCFAMLIGTTYAWFTDTVSSKGNVIQTGELTVGFQWANGTEDPATATWTDVSGAMFDYANWEPGYATAKHLKISNEGTLALNYKLRIVTDGVLTKLADVIDVYYFDTATTLARSDIDNATPIGTFAEVVGTEKNISNSVKGSLKPGDPAKTCTLVFKMNENADSTYESLDLGCDFTVELVATQMAYESDAFGTDYDDAALSDAVPAARVRSIGAKETVIFTRDNGDEVLVVDEDLTINATAGIGGAATTLNMDALYKFEPSQTFEELQLSEYKYYLADFIISADKDVPADSLALAGYYDAWCSLNNDNWVALSSPDDITAGTEIRLVESMGVAVHYKDICQYGNDGLGFMCGVVDLTGENAGTTITVKLCLFETTADPNGSSANTVETGSAPIEIGTFTYTFQ